MAELDKEVKSRVNTGYRPKTFGPGSNQPYSPGAFSNPGNPRSRSDMAPPQPPGPPASAPHDDDARRRRAKGDPGATARVAGPAEV
jgi:hypothetical protein